MTQIHTQTDVRVIEELSLLKTYNNIVTTPTATLTQPKPQLEMVRHENDSAPTGIYAE